MELNIVCKKFSELSVYELYDCLQLRNDVFVIEQQCLAPDMDDMDQVSHHLLLQKNGKLAGYARILPPGVKHDEVSIGRVVTSAALRGSGLGKLIMQEAIRSAEKIYGKSPVRIAAQAYATAFYEKLGFVAEGDVFEWDGIDHIEMLFVPDPDK